MLGVADERHLVLNILQCSQSGTKFPHLYSMFEFGDDIMTLQAFMWPWQDDIPEVARFHTGLYSCIV